MIHCGLCGERAFGTQDAFEAHCVSAGAHKGRFCKKCKRPCRSDVEFQRHIRREHGPTYKCDPCNAPFTSGELMQRHFSASDRHPNCERCRDGVEDNDLLEKHMKSKHPQKQCIVCGIFIYIDELEKHYLESLNHRNCARCNVGFETEQLYDEHLATVHTGEGSPSAGSPALSGDQPSQPRLRSADVAGVGEITMAAHLGRLQSSLTVDAPGTRDRSGDPFLPLRSELVAGEKNDGSIADLRTSRYGMPAPSPRADQQPVSIGPSRLPPPPGLLARSDSVTSPPVAPGFGTLSNGFSVMTASAMSPPTLSLHVRSPTNGNLLSGHSTPIPGDIWSRPLLPTSVSHAARVASLSLSPSRFTEDTAVRQQNHDEVLRREVLAGTVNHLMPALHCRICKANPCINITATFCGHVFCNRCITNRILSTPYCPVCDSATLLYMLFKLDLSD